ncbi:hypothetical protein GGR56DRAFT_658606 [Xylariaceae sp. FL0804]|nr:hypothetical protein GGR56DRAFT_658606 [Xylariaceae sp. FL0804]
MSTAVKRACDACHRRKVKCDGINPCRNCASAQLTCTYNAIPQKKGPKGSRAKVISELRETQRQTSLSAKVQGRLNGLHSPPCSPPSLAPTPGLLAPEMVKESIDFFFANMYSIMPILHRQRLEQQAMFMDQNLDTYCLLTSLSAYMLFQPGMGLPGTDPLLESMPGAHLASATLLMEETTRVRKGFEYLDNPSLSTMCTSYLLFCSFSALEMHEKAWYHLREATTMVHMSGMTKEETFLQYDNVEASRRRRLYWLLFVTERAYALHRGRPLTLQASISLPTMSDDPTDPLAPQLNNYLLLVNLFRPFDDTFIMLWNKTRGECSASYLGTLQKQFSEIVPAFMHGQDPNVRTMQQWLKTVTWHLSMQNSAQEHLFNQVDASRDLLINLTTQFQTPSTETLGVPLVAKLLEISYCLSEVLAAQPSSGDPFSIGPQQHLNSLLQLLSVLQNGNGHFLPLLLNKVHDVLPQLADPMLKRAPENANACLQNIDIFDGFGNAGMAQTPMITDFKTEPYASNGVAHLQDIPSAESVVSSQTSGAEMKSPYPMVSSPGITSPGGEYHGSEYSMPDMMTPMGQAQQPQMNHQQGQRQHQMHGLQPQGMNQQNHGINSQMQHEMHSNFNHGMNHTAGLANMGQSQNIPQNQQFNHMNQNIITSMLHRPPPQRSNSFMMDQQQQQQQQQQQHQPQQQQQQPQQSQQPQQHPQAQIPRTVGDFHALQRANSGHVPMSQAGLGQMQPEMDFSGLR